MEKKRLNVTREVKESKGNPVPAYEPPKIVTYTSEEIIEEIGPAQTCCPYGDVFEGF